MIPDRNGFCSHQGKRTGKRASNSRKKGSTSPPLGEQVRDLPLVAKDGLFFRFIPGVRDALPHQDFDPVVIAQTFRGAFTGVWEQIPPADRQRMLTYWHATHTHDKKHSPLIQVACPPSAPEVVLAAWGTELTFPTSLVAGQPHLLQFEIARTLAQSYRLATSEHWSLILEVIEEPLERWESQQGEKQPMLAVNES